MSYQKFLTENPFRILGIASTTMLPELRRYADVAIRSAEVGIRKVPPLEVEFGPTDFSGLASTVRALGNDPIRRTMHRFLWPDNFGIEVAGNTESLWSNREKLSKLNRQNDFLAPWFNFLLNAYANEATCALKNWHLLLHQEKEIETCSGQRSADFTKVNSRREYQLICVQFAELLVEEDDCARGVATKIVGAACNEISIYLLKRILAEAASKWSTDELQTSMALIKSVLDCPLPKSLKEQCFGQIIEIGDSLSSKIIGGIAELPDFQLGVIPTDRDLVFKLNCLIGVLKTHHPAVNRWQESVEEWTTARVWNMRKSMLKFNEEGDNETALLIVTEALIFAIDSKQRLTLQSDKVALSGYINQANLRKGYEGILPIDCAPSMSTVNGIGCRLYDDGPFPYDKTKHFAILYFTILYIPFLPITRYLVQDVQGNKWKFFGKTKFTAGMKAHVVVASLISLSCIFLIAVSEANKHPVIAQDPTQVSSSSETLSTGHASSLGSPFTPIQANGDRSSATTNTSNENQIQDKLVHRADLQRRIDELRNNLDSKKQEIANDEFEVKSERNQLADLESHISSNLPNTYNQYEVNDYNKKVQKFEVARKIFNDHVKSLNIKLDDEKKMVEMHNLFVDEFNGGR